MELSLFLAKFLGIYMLIIATIWVTCKNQFESAVKEIILSNGLFALTGAILLIVGLIMTISHPIWELNWRGLITVVAYLTLFQGILRLAFPEESRYYVLKSLQNHWFLLGFLVIVGFTLTYYGFN